MAPLNSLKEDELVLTALASLVRRGREWALSPVKVQSTLPVVPALTNGAERPAMVVSWALRGRHDNDGGPVAAANIALGSGLELWSQPRGCINSRLNNHPFGRSRNWRTVQPSISGRFTVQSITVGRCLLGRILLLVTPVARPRFVVFIMYNWWLIVMYMMLATAAWRRFHQEGAPMGQLVTGTISPRGLTLPPYRQARSRT